MHDQLAIEDGPHAAPAPAPNLEQLAFRCARRGGACDCPWGWGCEECDYHAPDEPAALAHCDERGHSLARAPNCGVDRALALPTPPCPDCGQPTRLEDRCKIEHQDTDDAALTLQLVELRPLLEAGVTWGAEAIVYYCQACDTAQIAFYLPDGEDAP